MSLHLASCQLRAIIIQHFENPFKKLNVNWFACLITKLLDINLTFWSSCFIYFSNYFSILGFSLEFDMYEFDVGDLGGTVYILVLLSL